MTDDPKCDACNQVENLKPCGFCGQPVVIRYNTMTGEHYISHEDWNSRCPQRPFYGGAEQWNTRFAEDTLRAENARLRNELDEIRRAYTDIMNEPCEDEVHCTCVPGLRAEIVKWIAANNAATTIINEQQAEIECLRRMIQR